MAKQPGISRATFLRGAAGAAAALTLPGRALAAGAGHDLGRLVAAAGA